MRKQSMNPEGSPGEILQMGLDILSDFMGKHSFRPSTVQQYHGSGGPSASCEYTCNERSLELHYRHSLGLVTYKVDDLVVSHVEYMKALGATDSKYPGFSEDPLDEFRGLLIDLQQYGSDFLDGTAKVHGRAAIQESEKSAEKNAKKMIGYVGDKRLRNEARAKFKDKDYSRVCQIFLKLEYPDDLSPAELKIFQISKNRS